MGIIVTLRLPAWRIVRLLAASPRVPPPVALRLAA